jgi:uncharacterized membrane protein
MEISLGMFMGVMFIVGVILTLYGFKLANAVKNCTQDSVQNSVRGLLIMGTILVTVAATYMVCGCGTQSVSQNVLGMRFVVLMIIIGLCVIGLASTIHAGCPDAQKDTPALITIAVLTVLVSGGYLGYTQLAPRSMSRF